MIHKARDKELGLDPVVCAELLNTVPAEALKDIKWTKSYSYHEFKNDMKIISLDLLKCAENSLYR